MFDYPPPNVGHSSGGYAGHSRYMQATSKLRELTEMAKRRRHDISIAVQSALSAVYAVELVFYFVRLRHLSGSHAAAWRASLMLSLLIIDMCLIWLTVRSKKQQVLQGSGSPSIIRYADRYGENQHQPAHAGNFGTVAPEQSHAPISSNPFADMPMDRFGGPLPGDMLSHPHGQQQFHNEHRQNHASEPRSHLNTPITD
ncbi:hypothetical protein IW140_000305 [Coemansia sp. RSA 1813]|nr:hypothetical protein EV178_000506 [Coemansia sp. RSA 1646]KAJ1773726.1 hypothetical protein LPJ74_000269 [Coemansia sp. RSA 1843]KAJ2093687.1 hypothetical protein IW138_000082 [Coemansia sp. RSA 986]KAJ2217901.1 hypothetical protein EV179_000045 [Coemansia sp. RSA 487]KAJ2573261.1 hypothetical protein IW140_000305 [Coemansia sp. RSA 1813]